MNQCNISAPAKLNLFLHINGRLDDGYHHIQTLFQPIDWCDQLRFSLRDDEQIRVSVEYELENLAKSPKIVRPELALQDNLVYKAAKLLRDYAGINQGVEIHLLKTIALGAGLGGGSSDAGATLIALNKLWQLHLPLSVLYDLAQALGADVPALVYRNTALAEGKGEKLYPIQLPPLWFLIFMPDCHSDTKTVFAQQELTRDTQIVKIADLKRDIKKDLTCLSALNNDCQQVVRALYPTVDVLINQAEQLMENKFSWPKLTGTGAAVFMMFTELNQAQRAQQEFLSKHPDHGLKDLRIVSSFSSNPAAY